MTIGHVFFIAAIIFFFLAGVGSPILPQPIAWGLVALALGLLLDDVPIRGRVGP